MIITQASIDDLEELTPLFNNYAVFYRQPSNPEKCRTFLQERFTNEEAIIFVARDKNGESMGFTLLYPSFSSVRRARIYILNDLYVNENHRKKGVGKALLETAVDFGKKMKAFGLNLETEISNENAQRLYETEGWVRENEAYHYNYIL